MVGMEIADFTGDGALDLAVFEGASSGLLGEDDIEEAGSALEPGNSAGILVYENLWAAPSPPPCAAAVRNWSPPGASRCPPCWPRWTPRSSHGRRPRVREASAPYP